MRTAGARVENAYGLEKARAGVTTLLGRRYVKHTGRKERKTEKIQKGKDKKRNEGKFHRKRGKQRKIKEVGSQRKMQWLQCSVQAAMRANASTAAARRGGRTGWGLTCGG